MLDPHDPAAGQTLFEHLAELRDRLIKAAWAIAVGTLACWFFKTQIFDFVRAPIQPYLDVGGLIFTNPIDKFMAFLKVSALGGIILSAPIWIYQAWMFVAPGLYSHERKYSMMFIGSGTLLFIIGVSFAYFLVLPTAFKFLLTFGGTTDKPMITINEYLSFFMTTTLVFGAAFEMPLIIVGLGAIGIVDHLMLRKNRRYAIVILAVISAVITPPDLMSMLLLLVPMVVLYEISILLVASMVKKRQI